MWIAVLWVARWMGLVPWAVLLSGLWPSGAALRPALPTAPWSLRVRLALFLGCIVTGSEEGWDRQRRQRGAVFRMPRSSHTSAGRDSECSDVLWKQTNAAQPCALWLCPCPASHGPLLTLHSKAQPPRTPLAAPTWHGHSASPAIAGPRPRTRGAPAWLQPLSQEPFLPDTGMGGLGRGPHTLAFAQMK